jgi:hypothetical protein
VVCALQGSLSCRCSISDRARSAPGLFTGDRGTILVRRRTAPSRAPACCRAVAACALCRAVGRGRRMHGRPVARLFACASRRSDPPVAESEIALGQGRGIVFI